MVASVHPRLINIGCCDALKVPTDGPASRMVASTNVSSVAATGALATAVGELSSAIAKPLKLTSSSTAHAVLQLAGRRTPNM